MIILDSESNKIKAKIQKIDMPPSFPLFLNGFDGVHDMYIYISI